MTERIVLNPASGVPLAQQLRERLATRITNGELRAGDRLPAVRVLATELKVNVNTVRLAYQRLERDGLVQTAQGVGTRVLPLNAKRLMQLAKTEITNTVGVIVPSLNSPFYYSFLQGVESIAYQHRSMLLVCQAHEPQNLLQTFAQLVGHRIDGVIAVSIPLCELVSTPFSSTTALPLVTADWPDCTSYHVEMDLKNAGMEATRHLIEHGHRRIGLITTRIDHSNVLPLNEGYRGALRNAGIQPDDSLIARVEDFGLEAGTLGARQLLGLPKPPTAIFAITDLLALGAMRGIREGGLVVPRDIAVASFNDSPFAALAQPALTSARAPAHALGLESMQMLASLIAGKKPPRKRLTLPTALVIRDSCGSHLGAEA